MKITPNQPPRTYQAGRHMSIVISDCGRIELEPNEQVTFTIGKDHEYDVARKSWGFYATPSLNGRLKNMGFRSVLIKNDANRFFVMLVQKGKESDFESYVDQEKQTIVCWLDDEAQLAQLEKGMKAC